MQKIISSKYLTLLSIAVLVILISGLFKSTFSDIFFRNWESKSQEKENEVVKYVQDYISEHENSLRKESLRIDSSLVLVKPGDEVSLLEIANIIPNNYFSNIFDSMHIVGWNKSQLLTIGELDSLVNKWGYNNAFVHETPLMFFLTIISEVDSYRIVVALPVQKKYLLHNKYFKNINIEDSIADKFNVGVSISYSELKTIQKSQQLKNANNKTIGFVHVASINKSDNVLMFNKTIELIQSLSFIFILIIVSFWTYRKIKAKIDY